MKLWLTTKPNTDTADYRVIKTFDEFIALDKTTINSINTIKLDDLLLGLSCLHWMIDMHFDVFGRVNFIIAIADKAKAEEFRISVNKYMCKYRRFKNISNAPDSLGVRS